MKYLERRFSAVPWLSTEDDLRAVGMIPAEETLNTKTLRIPIARPFGRDTDAVLEIYADRATGRIELTIVSLMTLDYGPQRTWQPYMGAAVTVAKSTPAIENDCNEPDEDA